MNPVPEYGIVCATGDADTLTGIVGDQVSLSRSRSSNFV